jgi:hypothetical protein
MCSNCSQLRRISDCHPPLASVTSYRRISLCLASPFTCFVRSHSFRGYYTLPRNRYDRGIDHLAAARNVAFCPQMLAEAFKQLPGRPFPASHGAIRPRRSACGQRCSFSPCGDRHRWPRRKHRQRVLEDTKSHYLPRKLFVIRSELSS